MKTVLIAAACGVAAFPTASNAQFLPEIMAPKAPSPSPTMDPLVGQLSAPKCKLDLVASFPITFVNNKPMVEVSINGRPAHLRFTLGGQTVLWGDALKDYDLTREDFQGKAYGEGGTRDVIGVRVREFKIGNFTQKYAFSFLAPAENSSEEAGVFGTSLADSTDVELDLAHNAVRFFKAEGCKDNEVVYWGGKYSVVAEAPSGNIPVKLAGQTLMAQLSPGNEVTFVTADGARRVAATLRAAGRLPTGMLAGVLKPVEVSIATFSELVVGDEATKNVSLAVGDIYPDNQEARTDTRITKKAVSRSDIVLGGDFIRSHRIYLSRDQKKIYFSYVGGASFADINVRLGATPALAPTAGP